MLCGPATCHHHFWLGIFRIFEASHNTSFHPVIHCVAAGLLLKIAYLVFASEHVFYPTRTDDKCRCQLPHCYSSCAVRNKHIAAATPLSVYTLYRTYLNSYTHIISANVHICWKFPLQNVFSHSMTHTVAYSAHPNGKIKISSRNLRR